MKKIALTSLLAVFAAAGANAANVIDGNPLYMPTKGNFYSVTDLYSHTEGTPYTLAEEFGYGVTNQLAIDVKTSLSENRAFDRYSWDGLSLKATFRALDRGAWKLDAYGEYAAGASSLVARVNGNGGALMYYPDADDETSWFDKDATSYTWTAGVRGGYTTARWTVAGHAAFSYLNSETLNWGDKGTHMLTLGVDGQFVLDSHWNLVAGVEYVGITNDHFAYDGDEEPGKVKNAGLWTGTFGVNYNIDATKFVGAYINGTMDHWKGDVTKGEKGWGFEDGFGFGAKFGIQF